LALPLKAVVENAVENAERRAIAAALEASGGNKTRAAKLLCVDNKTLSVKIKRYGLNTARG
jgi:DNA-binding NtrC family response regulator